MHVRPDFQERDPDWDVVEAQWLRDVAAGGDPGKVALRNLYRVYTLLFLKRLKRMGVEAADAEEAANHLWMEVTRAAGNWRGDRPVRTYLLGFLKNARRRWFRQHAATRLVGTSPLATDLSNVDELEMAAFFVGSRMRRPETSSAWFDFFRCMSLAWPRFAKEHPRMARLLELAHAEEYSLEEVARKMGGDAKLVKSQLFSARRKAEPFFSPCQELWPNE